VLTIALFLVLGIVFGVIMGLLPGIHPNMIVLVVPFLIAANLDVPPMLAFIVAMGVTNTVVDFVPSIIFGAPDEGSELAVLPGHRMLLAGEGYNAVKLCAIGSLGAMIFIAALLPALALVVPPLYELISPVIVFLLIGMVIFMVLSEPKNRKVLAVLVFALAGAIGLTLDYLPINSALILFPIFSGFFGVSVLVMQMKNSRPVPRQKDGALVFSRKALNRSIVFGSLAGVVAGFMPGVGSSEIAGIVSTSKNQKSFLVTMGALTAANTLLAIVCLWLISKPRSGLAVTIDQLATIGIGEVIFIVAVALVSIGIAVALTLALAKKSLALIARIDYSLVSKIIIAFIVVLTAVFTGALGLLILATCTALGIFTNMAGVKRASLMGVLILPTVLFYLGA
jgi:putative membrane protein